MKNKSGVHTLNTAFEITSNMYINLFTTFSAYAKENNVYFIPDEDWSEKWIEEEIARAERANRTFTYRYKWTLLLKQQGLNIILQKVYCYIAGDKTKPTKKFIKHYIRYIVNPAQVLGGDQFNIYRGDDFIAICRKIDEITASVCKWLPSMQDVKLRRIDFCHDINLYDLNIPTDDADTVIRAYIKLLKHYDLHKNFRLMKLHDEISGRGYEPASSTMLRRGGVTVYIYDKHHEMAEKDYYYLESAVSQSEGVLRVEVRVDNPKIYYEAKRRRLGNTPDFLSKVPVLSGNFFDYYLKTLFFEGDYYSYQRAQMIIEESGYGEKTKEKLKELLREISEKHSVNGGIRAMAEKIGNGGDFGKKGYTTYQIAYMIRQLNRINVNPVTIPRREKIDYLPNLLHFIRNDTTIVQ
jgi:hypothetical protein